METLTIAAIQMVSTADIDANLSQAAALIIQAKSMGAELVVLPENFAVFGGHDLRAVGERELTPQGPLRQFMAGLAQQQGLWLVGGTIPCAAANTDGYLPEQGKVFASSFVYDTTGTEQGRYDKMHLFDVDVSDTQGSYRESDTFSPGHCPLVLTTPWGGLGLSVCYDLRFPEYYRQLRQLGASLITVPAAFTYVTGQAHWEVLLRARAVENQCVVIGADQGGIHSSKRRTWGGSCIVSAWGEVLSLLPEGAGVVRSVVSLDEVARRRQEMPVMNHRRL